VRSRVCGQGGRLAGGRDLLARGIASCAEALPGIRLRIAKALAGCPGSVSRGPERIRAGLRFVASRHPANHSHRAP
jgi:hypothetical protein